MNLLPEIRSGRSVVHVLDEWAKSAPDTNGSVFGSTGSARQIGFALFSTYAEDE